MGVRVQGHRPDYHNTRQGYQPNGNEVCYLVHPNVQPSPLLGLNRDEIVKIIREHLGAAFKASPRPYYQRLYPDYIDQMFEFPPTFKLPNFTLFSGVDKQTTLEHMARFTSQCGEISNADMLMLRIFSSSLTGPFFTWYVNLPVGSIQTWQDMERAFHAQFYQVKPEITLVDLAKVKQKCGENIETVIANFEYARNMCKIRLSEGEYVRLAVDNLSPMLRMHFVGQQFTDLCHLVEVVSRYEKMLDEENQNNTSIRGTYFMGQNQDDHKLDTDEEIQSDHDEDKGIQVDNEAGFVN